MNPLQSIIITLKQKRTANKISWMVLKDILYRFWHIYVLIGSFSATTLALQVIGISIILSMFNGILTLPFGLSTELLVNLEKNSLIFLSFIVLSMSSIFLFLARKLIVYLMIKYEGICANELMSKISNRSLKIEDKSDSELIILLSKDCRFGGRIIQEFSNIVMPIGFSIIAFPLMFYLNFEATLILMAIMVLTLLPYSFIASKARTISYDFEKAALTDSQFKKTIIRNLRKMDAGVETPSLPHIAFKKAYNQRLIIPHYGIFIGSIQIACCLVALALLFVSADGNYISITNVVVYGFITIFTLNQLRSAAKVFASFHVFLAYFQRAFIIIKGIDASIIDTEIESIGSEDYDTDL